MKENTRIILFALAAILSGVASYWALYRPYHHYNTGWDWFLVGTLLCVVLIILPEASVTRVTIVERGGGSASGDGAPRRRSSADSSMEIVFALRDLDLQPYEQDHEGNVRFRYYLNREACAWMDEAVLNISVQLPFDDLSIRHRREVATRIDKIAGLHTTLAADGDDLLVTAMVPVVQVSLTQVMKDVLETRMRMAVGLYDEIALRPANEVRRTTAVMLLRAFFNENDDVFAAVCDVEDTNPLHGDDERSEQLSAYLEDIFGIHVLPDNFSRAEKVKDVVKLVSVYCDSGICYTLCRRAFLGTNV